MKTGRRPLERHISLLTQAKPREKLEAPQIGQRLGVELSKQLPSLSPTGRKSLTFDIYQRYIQVQFDVKQPHAHQRIISYNIDVRNLVAGGQTTLLTNQERFSNLYSAIFLPDGIEFLSTSSSLRRPTTTRTSKGTESVTNSTPT